VKYWIIDPRTGTLTVLRNKGRAFEVAAVATVEDAEIALEPFTGCALHVQSLFMEEAATEQWPLLCDGFIRATL
jgi:hypothetical protein